MIPISGESEKDSGGAQSAKTDTPATSQNDDCELQCNYNPTDFIILYDFIGNPAGLNLGGIEGKVFALIYSFSKDGAGCYYGGARYISERFGHSMSSIRRVLASLEKKSLILEDGKHKPGNNQETKRYVANLEKVNAAQVCMAGSASGPKPGYEVSTTLPSGPEMGCEMSTTFSSGPEMGCDQVTRCSASGPKIGPNNIDNKKNNISPSSYCLGSEVDGVKMTGSATEPMEPTAASPSFDNAEPSGRSEEEEERDLSINENPKPDKVFLEAVDQTEASDGLRKKKAFERMRAAARNVSNASDAMNTFLELADHYDPDAIADAFVHAVEDSKKKNFGDDRYSPNLNRFLDERDYHFQMGMRAIEEEQAKIDRYQKLLAREEEAKRRNIEEYRNRQRATQEQKSADKPMHE